MIVSPPQRSLNLRRASAAVMAFDPGAISSTLAAAVGDEPALVAELRVAFVESVG